jgi:hypothetical protein
MTTKSIKSEKSAKTEVKTSPTIQINRSRGGGGKKRPDLFARLRSEHPLDGLLPADNSETIPASNLEQSQLADLNIPASKDKTTLLATSLDTASKVEPSQLANSDKSANLLAEKSKNHPTLLAGNQAKSTSSASKLADLNKSASRSEYQQLADLRQSKGTRIQYATRIRKELKHEFDVFCTTEGIFQQDFIELAGISYIENYRQQLADLTDKSASNLALDDLRLITLWKTKPAIINLYLGYNSIFNEKTKWSTRDDDAGVALNDYDLKLIELGILQTHSNRGYGGGGKINSFSYYLPEIRNFAELEMGVETLNTMLQINRQRWKQATGREVDLNFLSQE